MKLDAGLGAEGGYLHNAGETARAAESLGFAGLWTSETKHDAFLPRLGQDPRDLAVAEEDVVRELQLGLEAGERGDRLGARAGGDHRQLGQPLRRHGRP